MLAVRPGSGARAYQVIAKELLSAIDEGRYAVGDRLPTEAELCERFDVSRFTVRSALAQLEQKGVVSRRPKIGTLVTARPDRKSYAVAVGSLSELLAFLDVTTVRPVDAMEVAASRALAADLHCEPGTKWLRVRTLRTPAGSTVPISWTEYYLQPRFRAVVNHIGKRPGPVYPILERRYKVSIASIEQDIGACLLSRQIAAAVSSKPGGAALRVIHRMASETDGVLYCTVSVYPADRFRYVQTLKRKD
jgi:DNA-binding GntR family transcriptional regulator